MEIYSETKRDRLERQWASKRELIEEKRHGLLIRVYWLKLTNQVSLSLESDDVEGREFIIPNDRVLDAVVHPEAYADRAGLPRAYED